MEEQHSQLVDDDVRAPELLHGQRESGDPVTGLRIPHQELMEPVLHGAHWSKHWPLTLLCNNGVAVLHYVDTVCFTQETMNMKHKDLDTHQSQPEEGGQDLRLLILK